MSSVEPRPQQQSRADEVLSIVVAASICVAAIVYVVVPVIPVLVAWEVLAVLYVVLVFVFRNRAARDTPAGGHALPSRILEYLSWAVPIAASGSGVTSAVTLLTTDGSLGPGSSNALAVGLLGSVGVVIAWVLLQTGFAEIYESVHARLPEASMISFPGIEKDPTLSDFLYMAFTVGTSFAVAGATISSRKVRRVVLIHSVTSFFYNAFLIAIAIQVVQGIIAGG